MHIIRSWLQKKEKTLQVCGSTSVKQGFSLLSRECTSATDNSTKRHAKRRNRRFGSEQSFRKSIEVTNPRFNGSGKEQREVKTALQVTKRFQSFTRIHEKDEDREKEQEVNWNNATGLSTCLKTLLC